MIFACFLEETTNREPGTTYFVISFYNSDSCIDKVTTLIKLNAWVILWWDAIVPSKNSDNKTPFIKINPTLSQTADPNPRDWNQAYNDPISRS